MSADTKALKKALTAGIISSFVLTVLYYVISVFAMLLEMSTMYSYETLSYILQTARDIFELAIYASGIALTLTFVRLKNKKYRNLAYISVLLVLFFDYGVAFVIDFAAGSIVAGMETFTVILLLLNFVARAALYALTVFFAERITANVTAENVLPVPFVSKADPSSKMLTAVFLIRIAPYIVFELYSNITGIIDYGFDMTGADVLSIISAYVEIILSGVLVYIISYLLYLLFLSVHEKAVRKTA